MGSYRAGGSKPRMEKKDLKMICCFLGSKMTLNKPVTLITFAFISYRKDCHNEN